MDYITTTQLRTQSKRLVNTLKDGGSVSLIHRSQIIGIFKPIKERALVKFDAKKFTKFIEELNLPPTTYAEREKRYRAHLEKKYGKGLS